MSNKRDKTPNQDRFKPSAKLNEQQSIMDKQFQSIVKGFEQLGEDLDESVVNRSKVLEAATQQKESIRAKSGEKKKFKINPNLKKSIDPDIIKQQLKEEQEAQQKMQLEQDEDNETLQTKKDVTFFNVEQSVTQQTKKKGGYGHKVRKEELGNISNQDDGVTELKNAETREIIEGTFEDNEEIQTEKPENMFEPTKLPFPLGVTGANQEAKKDEKVHHEILDKEKFNLLQFPAQFVYKLPQNAQNKIKIKRMDVEKLHDLREILNFNAQKPFDSAGNTIKYNYSTIDYFASKDPKKEQGFNMGKLRFYSDGSVQFISGQNIFDVNEGVQNQCKQNFVAIDQQMKLAENPAMFNIDNISKKFVIQPNIDELYKK